MINRIEDQLLLKTVADTNKNLLLWAQRLMNDYNLELGDNPRLVADIEHDLEHVVDRMQLLEPHFDLSRVPLRQANRYFAAIQQLEKAISLVQSIREKSYGSQQNTRRCLAHLNMCLESLYQMADTIPPASSLVQ